MSPVEQIKLMLQAEEQVKARYKRCVTLDCQEIERDIVIKTLERVVKKLERV
jgi:hypothetical protein